MVSSQLLNCGTFVTVVVLIVESLLIGSSRAYKFYVGGKDGWVLKPSEDYNHWAERNRFQVNDTLYFKYEKGSDSVLVVDKNDYYSCNTNNPNKTLSDGDSTFTFDHSGPFFFIAGDSTRCQNGQRIITVVMAVRAKASPSPPPPSPPISSPPPSTTAPPPSKSPSFAPPPGDNADAPAPSPGKSGSKRVVPGSVVGLVLGACVMIGSFVVRMA